MTSDEIVALVLKYEDRLTDAAAGNMAALWTLGLDATRAVSRDFWLGAIVGIIVTIDEDFDQTDPHGLSLGEVLVRLEPHHARWSTDTTIKFLRLMREIVEGTDNYRNN